MEECDIGIVNYGTACCAMSNVQFSIAYRRIACPRALWKFFSPNILLNLYSKHISQNLRFLLTTSLNFSCLVKNKPWSLIFTIYTLISSKQRRLTRTLFFREESENRSWCKWCNLLNCSQEMQYARCPNQPTFLFDSIISGGSHTSWFIYSRVEDKFFSYID